MSGGIQHSIVDTNDCCVGLMLILLLFLVAVSDSPRKLALLERRCSISFQRTASAGRQHDKTRPMTWLDFWVGSARHVINYRDIFEPRVGIVCERGRIPREKKESTSAGVVIGSALAERLRDKMDGLTASVDDKHDQNHHITCHPVNSSICLVSGNLSKLAHVVSNIVS
jgi:hypothetical protein